MDGPSAPELNQPATTGTEQQQQQQQQQQTQPQAQTPVETCSSAPPTTLQFESQSAATSLGYITNPTSSTSSSSSSDAAPATADAAEAKIQELSSSSDGAEQPNQQQQQQPDSFEFDRQQPVASQDQHVPLTAPIDRSFDLGGQNRFHHYPQQHQHQQPDSNEAHTNNAADRRSPYLPPFRSAYSMPDRPYSDSGAYAARSSSPAMHHPHHQQQTQSMPEPAYAHHPAFMHPAAVAAAGYHYAPQHQQQHQQSGSASVGSGTTTTASGLPGSPHPPDMSAVPRMPPPYSLAPPHPAAAAAAADPYLRQHPGQMPPPPPGMSPAAAPPHHFGSAARPLMYPPHQHHISMPPPPLSAPAPPQQALVRSAVGSDGSEDAVSDRSLVPSASTGAAAKPGQNQGTPFISKLMQLLSNDRYSAYIRWNSAGDAFILSHTNQYFASQVLPLYFRHSNTSSFIRQLNLYQFQRLPIMQLLETLDDGTSGALAGATAPSSCFSGFSHPLFKRDHEELSYMIKPKPGKIRDRSAAAVAARKAKQPEDMSPTGDSPQHQPHHIQQQQQHHGQSSYQPPARRATDIYKSEPSRRGLRSSKRLEHSDGQEQELKNQQMMYPAYAAGLSAQP